MKHFRIAIALLVFVVSLVITIGFAPTQQAHAATNQLTTTTSPDGINLGDGTSTGITTTTEAPPDPQVKGDPGPGLFDVAGRVRKAIDSWFKNLVTSALNPTLDLLGSSILHTPEATTHDRVTELWRTTLIVANSLFVLFVLVGGAIVMSHETLQSRYAAKDIAPRLVFAVIAANASLSIVALFINFANALSTSFLTGGVSTSQAAATMKQLALAPLDSGGIFLILIALVVAALALYLVAVYILRLAALVLLVISAPLALATHALPQTESIARLWWRLLGGILGIQVAQSLVLISAMRIFFAPDGKGFLGLADGSGLVDLLVILSLLYVLCRLPSWVLRISVKDKASNVTTSIKSIVVRSAAKAAI